MSGPGVVVEMDPNDPPWLAGMATRIAAVPGIVAVALGGSRARGDALPGSDVDLGLYYRGKPDLRRLRALARRLAGPDAELTEPGGWGTWVDGGGWLTVDGVAVDWIYRDLDRVQRCWTQAQQGRFAFHQQVGHPLGVPDFSYPAEVGLAVVLADPTGELAAMQSAVRVYPEALRAPLVRLVWEAAFTVEIARKGAVRGDTTYVAGALARAMQLCAYALHGHARVWLTNEKGAVTAAGRLPGAPTEFAERAHAVLGRLGTTAAQLTAAVGVAANLVADTEAACAEDAG